MQGGQVFRDRCSETRMGGEGAGWAGVQRPGWVEREQGGQVFRDQDGWTFMRGCMVTDFSLAVVERPRGRRGGGSDVGDQAGVPYPLLQGVARVARHRYCLVGKAEDMGSTAGRELHQPSSTISRLSVLSLC